MKDLSSKPEYKNIMDRFYKRIVKAKSINAKINTIATGGAKNRNILAVQSRIKRISNKNRFKDLKQKIFGNKPHSLSQAVKNNHRNMQTQSKK